MLSRPPTSSIVRSVSFPARCLRRLRTSRVFVGTLGVSVLALALAAQDRRPLEDSPPPIRVGSLRGRALVHGEPARDAVVRVRERSRISCGDFWGNVAEVEHFQWGFDWGTPPFSAGTHRTIPVANDGRFVVEMSDTDRHLIEIVTAAGQLRVLEQVNALRNTDVDLGDIELLEPGTLRGRVSMPHGLNPSRATVHVWSLGQFDVTNFIQLAVRADGSFELERAPSTYLVARAESGAPYDGRSKTRAVRVRAHETSTLEFELVQFPVLREREIEVSINGSTRSRVRLDLRPMDALFAYQAVWTNELGFVRPMWMCVGPSVLLVRSERGLAISSRPLKLDWNREDSSPLEIVVHAGRLRVRVPPSALDASFTLTLLDGRAERFDADARIPLETLERQELGWARVGWHTFTLEARSAESDAPLRWRRRVAIVPGRTTEVVFRERDSLAWAHW